MKGQFQKGDIPWNKGDHSFRPSQATEFKTGDRVMEKHPCWKGGVQDSKSDCKYVMVAPNKRVRRPRQVYEDHNGPVPEGYVIYHLDGDRKNDDPTNLEAIDRAELMKINSRR